MTCRIVTAFLLGTLSLARVAAAEDPWADAVLSHNFIDPVPGFGVPERTVGAPTGGTTQFPNLAGVASLGVPGSFIVLKFDTPVTDDAQNPMGLDFIVYSNAFWVSGDPHAKFTEPALIEISEDVNANGQADDPWYVVPGSEHLDASILPAGIPNPNPPLAGNVTVSGTTEEVWGYAELTPTQSEYLDNYLRPDDPLTVGLTARSGGGDAFDIAWAVDENGDPANLTQFDFLRISPFLVGNLTGLGPITPEIDAVSDVAPEIDSDSDGILDEYEARVSGTDPNRPESTVLPLEIPAEEGGSPEGALLGRAEAADGAYLQLQSAGPRSGARAFNVIVDLAAVADPGDDIPGQIKSNALLNVISSASDFVAAQIQPGEVGLPYAAEDITGLDESLLAPYRHTGAGYTQDGISNVIVDSGANRVTFRSRHAGIFILASQAGEGDGGTPPGPPIGPIELSIFPGGPDNPGPSVSTTDVVRDVDGRIVANGTMLTVVVTNATIVGTDASSVLPGHQITLLNGVGTFLLEPDGAPGDTPNVIVELYNSDQTELLGSLTIALEVIQLPLGGAVWLVLLLFVLGVWRLRRGRVSIAYASGRLSGIGHSSSVPLGLMKLFSSIPALERWAISRLSLRDGEAISPSEAKHMPRACRSGTVPFRGLAAPVPCFKAMDPMDPMGAGGRGTPGAGKSLLADSRGQSLNSRGFTLVELLVVIAIISTLMVILLPALSRAQAQGRAMQCVSNLRQLYLANVMYAAEHSGRYVPAAPDYFDFLLPGAAPDNFGGRIRWHGERETPNPLTPFDPDRGPLAEYLTDGRVKECPEFFEFRQENGSGAFEAGTGGYGYNMAYIGSTLFQSDDLVSAVRKGANEARISQPGSTIMFADAAIPTQNALVEYSFVEPPYFASAEHPRGNTSWGFASPSMHFRHYGRANVMWADGHASSEKWEWAPEFNIYNARNSRWSVGWFGPENNYFFDSGMKDGYSTSDE